MVVLFPKALEFFTQMAPARCPRERELPAWEKSEFPSQIMESCSSTAAPKQDFICRLRTVLITSSDPPTPFSCYSMAAKAAFALWFESTGLLRTPELKDLLVSLQGHPIADVWKHRTISNTFPCQHHAHLGPCLEQGPGRSSDNGNAQSDHTSHQGTAWPASNDPTPLSLLGCRSVLHAVPGALLLLGSAPGTQSSTWTFLAIYSVILWCCYKAEVICL